MKLPLFAAALLVPLASLADAPPPSPGCKQLRWVEVDGLGSSGEELERVAQLTGQAPLRSLLFRRPAELAFPLCEDGQFSPGETVAPPAPTGGLEWRVLPVTSRTFFNSNYPSDRNDGALWAGRGVSTDLHAGLAARWRWFSAQLAPSVAWQQNRAFWVPLKPDGTPLLPYNRPNYFIDLPERMGSAAFWTPDPGQSYVRADAFGAALGLSTENLWWGPGTRHSLLMTNTAPGFPHLFLGTSRPVDIRIGTLEAQVLWAHLDESPGFDADPRNDRRLLSTITLGFSPRFVPGLSVGAARVYLYTLEPGKSSLRDYLVPLVEPLLKRDLATSQNPSGNRLDNQLAAVFARYALPQVGFELYGEWARDDHSWDLEDLAMEPGHSSAYLLGLQKLFALDAGTLRVMGELVELTERPVSRVDRMTPEFYTHYAVRQGYTHRGQMLGDWLGPGGSGASFAVDLFHGTSRFGLFFERNLRHERAYLDVIKTLFEHDLELTGGLRHSYQWQQLELSVEASLNRRWNRDFGANDRNWSALASVTWWPGRTHIPALGRSR